MNGVIESPVIQMKYSKLLAYYPDTGNPFFQGVFRRYHCHQNPVKYIDPDGKDIWIEGPSGDEPAGHMSINVGDPKGEYNSYSFGVDRKLFTLNGIIEGEVYVDPEHGGEIINGWYLTTKPSEDIKANEELKKEVGKKSGYGTLASLVKTAFLLI